MADTPFSVRLRAGSHDMHTAAESSAFITDLLGGRLGVDAYTRYTEQLWFVYRALEDAGARLADDAVAGPFIQPELARVPELERDLAHLHGASQPHSRPRSRPRSAPLPATAAYAARIEECAGGWPAGYVAHHYTRYLGDLSGGQVIRGTAEKTWGFAPKGDGVRFYVFAGIPNPAAYKRAYRRLLDELPLDELGRRRMIAECRRAFAMNEAVFTELGEEYERTA